MSKMRNRALIAILINTFLSIRTNAFSHIMQPCTSGASNKKFSRNEVNLRLIKNDSSCGSSRRSFLVDAGASATLFGGCMITSTFPAVAANIPATEVKAPYFELPNSRGDGNTSLSDLTKDGKWTVLYFYPGAFTSGCTLEARGFQRDISKYSSLNTQIVGVSVDAVEKNASFCNTEGLDFYMLSDEKGLVSKKYGSSLSIPGFGTFSNRQTYIIDPNGTLKWVFTDVESRVARHSMEVLDKLEELQKA